MLGFIAKTPALPGARSIATMEQLTLGGLKQWVVIRGHETQNPILVYLHGGPGGSDYAPVRKWLPELEERFTIVHWCQRGSNKSYDKAIPRESMTVAQILDDLHELVQQMTERFGQQKVFIAGQSVGTIFGLLYAQRHPERVHAYIGINQIVDRAAEERISYEYTLKTARERGLAKAVRELEALGAPVGGEFKTGVKGTVKQRGWMSKLGIVSFEPKRIMAWQKSMLLAPELTWPERVGVFKGLIFSMESLWTELCGFNFQESVTELQVPAFFVAGRQDHITSTELTEAFVAGLRAPQKELLVLESSGHIALFEEPERFLAFMLNVVRPVAEAMGAQRVG